MPILYLETKKSLVLWIKLNIPAKNILVGAFICRIYRISKKITQNENNSCLLAYIISAIGANLHVILKSLCRLVEYWISSWDMQVTVLRI